MYVYVHKLGQEESRKSLVFRYADKPVPYPKFEWINDSSLRISVGDVSQVTKQLDTMCYVDSTDQLAKQRIELTLPGLLSTEDDQLQ